MVDRYTRLLWDKTVPDAAPLVQKYINACLMMNNLGDINMADLPNSMGYTRLIRTKAPFQLSEIWY